MNSPIGPPGITDQVRAINGEYEGRRGLIRQLDVQLRSDIMRGVNPNPMFYQPGDEGSHPLLNFTAYQHLEVILNMAGFAFKDLETVAGGERQVLLANIKDSRSSRDDPDEDIRSRIQRDGMSFARGVVLAYGGEKAMYSFVHEICTMVDNIYLMVGKQCRFPKMGKGTRSKVTSTLREHNPLLGDYLREHFFNAEIMRETQELRNTVSHEIPVYEVRAEENKRDPSKGYRLKVHIQHRGGSRRKPMFEYMYTA